MSRIVAGAGISYRPVLAMRPVPMWVARAAADRANAELYDLGAAGGLAPRRRDDIPAYRAAAGTGTGSGFGPWA